MGGSHGEKDLLERILLVSEEGEHATDVEDEVVEEEAVHIGFDAFDKDWQILRPIKARRSV